MSDCKYAATAADGKEILRILESSASKGSIELLYTRRPDAYASYQKESGEPRVFVSKKDGRVIGTCAELIREVYIDGEVRKAAYVCGLKKDASRNSGVGFGPNFIRGLYREDIDFYCCSVVSENRGAQTMFAKRSRLISMRQFASYKTYILSPRVRIIAPAHTLTFRRAEERDVPQLLDFLSREGAKKDLFPVVRSLEQFYNLRYHDFYLLEQDGVPVAAGALWDQTDYKQYVVKQYRGMMKLARFANPVLSVLRYIRLPAENEPLCFPMLSFLICKNDDAAYYRIFLSELKKEIAATYDMFVIGLPNTHPASPLFDSLPSISFETKLYEITFPWNNCPTKTINEKKMHPECALL